MEMRHVLLIATGLLAAGQLQAQITYLTDYRNVSVSVQAPSPPAFSASDSGNQFRATAFDYENLSVTRSIDWPETNGWVASSVSALATMEAAFSVSGTDITLNNHLTAAAGGDPYGIHFQPGVTGTAQAGSIFEVTFSLSAPVGYSYLLDFDTSPTLQASDLTLSSTSYGVQQLFRTSGSPNSGTLQPDTYTLRFEYSMLAANDVSADLISSLTFSFDTSPSNVPEPSSSLLLGLALMGMLVLRLKKQQKAPARALAAKRRAPVAQPARRRIW
jgi:hypothetical protein